MSGVQNKSYLKSCLNFYVTYRWKLILFIINLDIIINGILKSVENFSPEDQVVLVFF